MVKVVTDSSCDIPIELARRLGITIIPLYIQIGTETYRDGIDIGIDRLYYELAHAEGIPKTSAPSPGDFVKIYNDLAMETDQIISIHLSSKYSGTYNTARLAESYVRDKCRVELVDANSVSIGLGLVVITAAEAAQEGKSLDEVVEIVQQVIQRSRMFGKIDSLTQLLKGKRFHLTEGLIVLGKIGTALGIRLVGEVYDGGKIRSPVLAFGRTRAMNQLEHWIKKLAPVKKIAIAHSTNVDEAEILAERLKVLLSREQMLITRLGCLTSMYVGPGTLAVALISGK
ncbi:MAG: DegV family protein [Chloroflexota bacterium]|nr:DegV family protein [Chloroflexota bacterium]